MAFVLYATAVLLALYGPAVVGAVRAATGSIPPRSAPVAVSVAIGWVGAAAVAGGLAGGPWLPHRATVAWVLPSQHGLRVLRRLSVAILIGAAAAGAVAGALTIVGFQSDDDKGLTSIATGMLGGATVAVVAGALAILVQPRDRRSWSYTAGTVLALGGVAVIGLAADGTTPSLATAAGGGAPSATVLAIEAGIAGLLAIVAWARTPSARMGRLDARSRATGLLPVILFNRDLRSLRAVAHLLSGERPRDRPPREPRRLGPVATRHLHSLRRSSGRRAHRVLMLVAAGTWGWWLVSLGSRLGVATVIITAWLCALETAEPLGAEVDRPQLVPHGSVRHRLRHVGVGATLLVPVLLAPGVVLLPVLGGDLVGRAVVALGPALVVASAAGAAHALLRPDRPLGPEVLIAPEAMAAVIVQRESIPLLLTALGLTPLLTSESWTTLHAAASIGARATGLAAIGLALVIGVAHRRAVRATMGASS